MPNQKTKELFYDPMPRSEVRLPPLREPRSLREESGKLVEPNREKEVETHDYLSNLVFK